MCAPALLVLTWHASTIPWRPLMGCKCQASSPQEHALNAAWRASAAQGMPPMLNGVPHQLMACPEIRMARPRLGMALTDTPRHSQGHGRSLVCVHTLLRQLGVQATCMHGETRGKGAIGRFYENPSWIFQGDTRQRHVMKFEHRTYACTTSGLGRRTWPAEPRDLPVGGSWPCAAWR
jgi:hypothetical protein